MLLPECSSTPPHLESVLTSFSRFYLVRNLPLHKLLDKEFLETAVYQGNICNIIYQHTLLYSSTHLYTNTLVVCVAGSVYGLSYRTRIDEDNCVALMPNGKISAPPPQCWWWRRCDVISYITPVYTCTQPVCWHLLRLCLGRLVLSLDKDSFQVLGFEGKPSTFGNRTKNRFGLIQFLFLLLSHKVSGGSSSKRHPEPLKQVLVLDPISFRIRLNLVSEILFLLFPCVQSGCDSYELRDMKLCDKWRLMLPEYKTLQYCYCICVYLFCSSDHRPDWQQHGTGGAGLPQTPHRSDITTFPADGLSVVTSSRWESQ